MRLTRGDTHLLVSRERGQQLAKGINNRGYSQADEQR